MGTNHVIVAHGKSKILLLWGLFTRFDIDANIFSLDNGEHSIVISYLPQVLSKKPFISEKTLADRWGKLNYRSGLISSLRIFSVVDYDRDNRNALLHITGNLLGDILLAGPGHPVPILDMKSFVANYILALSE